MGNVLSSYWSPPASDEIIVSSLTSSQLVHRHTLSTCYDAICDVSLSSKSNSILLSDDGRLRLFSIDLKNGCQLTETTALAAKLSNHEQVLDIVWSTGLYRFLILTSKRLATFDDENNLINLNLQVEKDSPPFWRMASWSSHLIINLGLGSSIRYHKLISLSSIPLVHSFTRASLGYTSSDLLSTIVLSPQLVLAINVELADNRHVIDLFSIKEPSKFQLLKRIDSNEPCPLDVIASLRNCTWLCKSHWPSDDCLCIVESDGHVKRFELKEPGGYILNFKVLLDRSHVVIVRTPDKLPKQLDDDVFDQMDQEESQQQSKHGVGRVTVGKLPGNLLLEVYKIPTLS